MIFGRNPFDDSLNHPNNFNYNSNKPISKMTSLYVVYQLLNFVYLDKELVREIYRRPLTEDMLDFVCDKAVGMIKDYIEEDINSAEYIEAMLPHVEPTDSNMEHFIDYRGNDVTLKTTINEDEYTYLCILYIIALKYTMDCIPEIVEKVLYGNWEYSASGIAVMGLRPESDEEMSYLLNNVGNTNRNRRKWVLGELVNHNYSLEISPIVN